MKTILVTGAAGFIGSCVVNLLREDGYSVVGVDSLNDYYDVRLKDLRLSSLLGLDYDISKDSLKSRYDKADRLENDGFVFRIGNIEDLGFLDRLFEEFSFDAVINLAARAGVRYSMDNPHVYISTNTAGSLNLLECLRKYDVKKYILASTSSLYAGQKMPFEESLPVNTPISPYAASKKASEVLAYTYHLQFGIDVSVLRYFTVYGPKGRPDMAPLRFAKWIKEGTPITLFGNGDQSRDFTHVKDIARGTIMALQSVGYEIFNLGGNKPYALHKLIEHIERYTGNEAVLDIQAENPVDMKDTWANVGKTRRILGWEAEIGLRAGVESLVKDMEDHWDLYSQLITAAPQHLNV